MIAITIREPGDESMLELREIPAPLLSSPTEVRIAVEATAVNRADLFQRQGQYPPPAGASPILGMECGGRITEVGSAVSCWKTGDRVMSLLTGGGYAEETVVDEKCVMAVPDTLSFEEAGAFPETFLTAFLNIFLLGEAIEGQSLLVHGGGSGVGTSSIILGKLAGLNVIVTAGSDEKCRRCLELGATNAINYRKTNFAEEIGRITEGKGVDLILDSIGGPYLEPNIESLAFNGTLVMIGGMGGRKGEVDIGRVLSNHLRILGSTLRSRSAEQKGIIISAFLKVFGENLQQGRIRPVIDRVLPLSEAAHAHQLMKKSEHFGKIVLRVQ